MTGNATRVTIGERNGNTTRRAASENAVIVMNIFSSHVFCRVAAVENTSRFFASRRAVARVLAAAKTAARLTAEKAARSHAAFSKTARPLLARAAAKSRLVSSREYSRQRAPRILVAVACAVLAALLLALNVSRANAQSSENQKNPSVAAKAAAKTIARADADFDNADPGRSETAWGRLVADAMKSASGADFALLSAASLAPGTLKKRLDSRRRHRCAFGLSRRRRRDAHRFRRTTSCRFGTRRQRFPQRIAALFASRGNQRDFRWRRDARTLARCKSERTRAARRRRFQRRDADQFVAGRGRLFHRLGQNRR